MYPPVYRVIMLVLTLPVSTATTERSFSAMRIVKTRLRNHMDNDFLTDSLLMYIEKEIAEKFDINSIGSSIWGFGWSRRGLREGGDGIWGQGFRFGDEVCYRLVATDSLRAKARVIDGDSRVRRFFSSGNNRVVSAVLAELDLSLDVYDHYMDLRGMELARFALEEFNKQKVQSVYHGIGIVKLMGRTSGFIAMHASLATGQIDI
ncbi:hypothetical protein ACLB2K_002452 [Fragaria x ananassa]